MQTETLAWKIRKDVLNMTHEAHASHIGSMLSCTDIIAVLYGEVANITPQNYMDDERDRVVLSKGHSGAAVYAALAEMGFFPREELKEYGKNGSKYSCHISHKGVNGVELTTGSLGHGACVAAGMALNGKLNNKKYNVYSIIGDGECDEGSIWEMALMCSHYRLDNYTVIIDRNNMQAMGLCDEIMNTNPLDSKWKDFGWEVIVVPDGNNHDLLRDAFGRTRIGLPRVIIANTIKGKGVSFMENELLWHYRDPQGELFEKAIRELEDSKPCGIE